MLDFGFYNMDCMDGMKQFSDNYFDLAIVDPPYGIGYDKKAAASAGKQSINGAAPKKLYKATDWDASVPDDNYFRELFRVSKNQIIWGGGIITNYLPRRALFVGISVTKV